MRGIGSTEVPFGVLAEWRLPSSTNPARFSVAEIRDTLLDCTPVVRHRNQRQAAISSLLGQLHSGRNGTKGISLR